MRGAPGAGGGAGVEAAVCVLPLVSSDPRIWDQPGFWAAPRASATKCFLPQVPFIPMLLFCLWNLLVQAEWLLGQGQAGQSRSAMGLLSRTLCSDFSTPVYSVSENPFHLA